jgi:hypothetical protein
MIAEANQMLNRNYQFTGAQNAYPDLSQESRNPYPSGMSVAPDMRMNNDISRAVPIAPAPEMTQVFEELEKETQELQMAADDLCDRLRPVMLERPVDGSKPFCEERKYFTAMAGLVCAKIQRVRAVRKLLREMLADLQV